MRHRMGVTLLLCLLASLPLTAQTLVVEARAGVETLIFCEEVHIVPTCQHKHVSDEVGVSVGATIRLDDERYLVEWMGPGYYLGSGLVLQPVGVTRSGLRGQRWLEVYPEEGRSHTSRAWKDTDGNRALSISDTLALDAGPASEVKDVRLQLRVRRVAEESQE